MLEKIGNHQKQKDLSVGLPGPLQTTFELNKLKTSVTNDAATLTLHALNWIKRPKISLNIFEIEKQIANMGAKI